MSRGRLHAIDAGRRDLHRRMRRTPRLPSYIRHEESVVEEPISVAEPVTVPEPKPGLLKRLFRRKV